MHCIDCGIEFYPDTDRERCIDCHIAWLASQQVDTADEPMAGRVVHGYFMDGEIRPEPTADERLAEGFAAMEGV
jgi:hypothetical protein